MMTAFRQGQLDGLCGVYALVNSIRSISGYSDFEINSYWKFLASELAIYKPTAFYEGLYGKELKHLIDLSKEYFPLESVRFSFPFFKKRFDTVDQFATSLANEINDKNAVAIIGFGHGWDHWTVARKVSPKSIHLIDSSNRKDNTGYSCIRLSSATVTDEFDKIDIHPRQTVIVSR